VGSDFFRRPDFIAVVGHVLHSISKKTLLLSLIVREEQPRQHCSQEY
jgi:hypothetical protein